MKIKHKDLEINIDKPFDGCKLDREKYANILSDIVKNYSDGFVLAINNEWGAGKTTFVKMWQQQLENHGHQTIYFNAWENDFDSNPLVALMSELNTITNESNDHLFKSILEKGAVIVKNILPNLAKSLISKHVLDLNIITENTVEDGFNAATSILESEIKNYTNKKKNIKHFRKELEIFVKSSKKKQPLIFIVDELDRCRPNYAVDILEQVKHFFSVSGIVFVLSIDKKHLASSIKGYYGSEYINTDEYLRRFIDLEYNIPAPLPGNFINYLFHYYGFEHFFNSKYRSQISLFKNDASYLISTSEILFSKPNVTLRQQEKIFAYTRLVLCTFKDNEYVFVNVLLILVYIKILDAELYKKIENRTLRLQEFSDELAIILLSNTNQTRKYNLVYLEAMFLVFYNNNFEREFQTDLIQIDQSGAVFTPIKSAIELKLKDWNLLEAIKEIKKARYDRISISYLINKIGLTETLNSL